MSAEVLLLCLSGSLYPVALVTIIRYLGGERRMQRSVAFAIGAAVITAVTGTAVIVLVRTIGLTKREHPTPSALFDVVVGVGVVAFSTVLLLRFRRRSAVDAGFDNPGELAEVRPSDGSLSRAFVVGTLVYLPMLSYFAAVKIVADQPTSVALTAFWVFVCIVVTLLVVEVPIAVTAIAGERSEPLLARMSQLVNRYTTPVLLIAGVAVGVYLILKGLLAL